MKHTRRKYKSRPENVYLPPQTHATEHGSVRLKQIIFPQSYFPPKVLGFSQYQTHNKIVYCWNQSNGPSRTPMFLCILSGIIINLHARLTTRNGIVEYNFLQWENSQISACFAQNYIVRTEILHFHSSPPHTYSLYILINPNKTFDSFRPYSFSFNSTSHLNPNSRSSPTKQIISSSPAMRTKRKIEIRPRN